MLFFCATYLLDHFRSIRGENLLIPAGPQQNQCDPDVFNEDARVMDPSCQDPIKANRITKGFPNGHTAINAITFGVEKKQIFGLLGPNGAGKSTTFNILTARLKRDVGSASLLGHEIDSSDEQIWDKVGICP
jgi:ATP-binding cassette subfamily A (ABC1) protein 3